MIFRWSSIFCFVLLTTVSEVRGEYFYQCYDNSNLPNTICLSTVTDSYKNWQEAIKECKDNGSTLIDVANETVQSILNQFRRESGSQLSNVGNWIDVYSVSPTTTSSFQWIDGSSTAGEFKIENQNNPPTHVFAAIRKDGNGNGNSPVYWAQTNDVSSSYICQFKDTNGCVDGGGFIRNSACYKKYTDMMTWFQASNACLREGGSLAIFTYLEKPFKDADLTAWLNVTDTQSYWIGLVRRWWVRSGGSVIQYSNWSSSPSPYVSPAFVLIESNTNAWLVHDSSTNERFVCQTIRPKQTTGPIASISISATNTGITYPPSLAPTVVTTPLADGSTNTPSNIPMIIGIAVGVGGTVVICAIVLIVLLVLFRRRGIQHEVARPPNSPSVQNDANNEISLVEPSTSSSKEIIYADIVKVPLPSDQWRADKPDVLQTQQVIYADLATVDSQSEY